MAQKNYQLLGDQAWKKMEKANGELFALTYGALVTQMIKDYENMDEVNKQLEKMGNNIGMRVIDEYFAKSGVGRCTDFKDAAESLTRIGLKMFLGINARTANWSADGNEFSIIIEENPLAEFVELPDSYMKSLWYSNVLCGVIRGSLDMVQFKVEARFVKDQLRGDDVNEIRVVLKEILKEETPFSDED